MSTGECNASSNGIAYSLNPQYVTIPAAIGSTWYVLKSAKKGKLESVVIKKHNIVCNRKTFGKMVISYIDTTNAIWKFEQLCDRDTAVQLSIEYYESQTS